jgi:transcriptional regulator GlxA family with amidase domain
MTRAPITVGILLYDDVQPLDLAGPVDVFGAANASATPGTGYVVHTLSSCARAVRSENGLRLSPDLALEDAPHLDTLIVPGGSGARTTLSRDPKVLAWLAKRAPRSRRVVGICTGVFVLAAAGLIDGKRVTTHWRFAAEFRERFPRVRLDTDPLYLRDGRFYSSGGLTAGIDLALALVAADRGAETALGVARELVMYMHRPGNQAQFSAPLDAQTRGTRGLAPLVNWMLTHLRDDLSVARLAQRANMSERNFRRVFRETFEMTPANFVGRLRLERACTLLASGNSSISRIASTCGFTHADVFGRAFQARYGASPSEYRERFRSH